MSDRIHDHESDTSEAIVRSLLADQCPAWSNPSLTAVRRSGTSNAMWRLHRDHATDLVVRLPRHGSAAESLRRESHVLRSVAKELAPLVRTPVICHEGLPSETFPHPWSVLEWLDGTDLWEARETPAASAAELAVDLAAVVQVLGELHDVPAPPRVPGQRGGPLGPVLERLDAWLDDPGWHADRFLDIDAVRASVAESADDGPVDLGFVHGDLIPGNLLVADGRLHAIVDWGSTGHGDVAVDLTPAWAVFDRPSRAVFRERLGVDDPTWRRARAFALEQAVGGVVYYKPRHHPLGDVMARTLNRILTDG